MDERLPRKLAAILYADVAGYSRLTGDDEDATHRVLSEYLDLIANTIASSHGQVMHYAGDAVLAKFDAVTDAVSSASKIQEQLAERNMSLSDDRRVDFRIGVNIGDVIEDRGDIYGDGVNIAARLESLANPGGICVSEAVRSAVKEKLDVYFKDMGEQTLKNISEPVRAYQVLRGEAGNKSARRSQNKLLQEVRIHTTDDGISLAYSMLGDGPPLVKAANWMNHLQFEVQNPPWQHWWSTLSDQYQLIRYDQRGNGLSDWDVDNLTFDYFVSDLESLVDHMKVERFALLGISQGCAVSVAYAVRHPERVSHLILYGGYVQGWRKQGLDAEKRGEAFSTLIEQGWGQDNPAFRQLFTSMFMPGASQEQMDAFNELEKISVSQENALRLHHAFGEVDVVELLSQVSVPTLVLHCRDDARAPFASGRAFAAGIPNARFVALEGKNHIILPNEPAWTRFLEEINSFCKN
jgi:class 3 adenylate cyclase/pimeloyl-ACP methyl ester carboxylesterase